MMLLPVIEFSLPLLCPLNGFAFPPVSPFCPVYNLGWINDFRSDYPLNSASAASSYFEALPLGQSARALLPLKPMLLIVLFGPRFHVWRSAKLSRLRDIRLGRLPTCASIACEVASQNACRCDLFNSRTRIFSDRTLAR